MPSHDANPKGNDTLYVYLDDVDRTRASPDVRPNLLSMPELEERSRDLKTPTEFPLNGCTPSQVKIASLESQLLALQTTLSESLNEMSKRCEENFNLTERVCELEQALYDMSIAKSECSRRKDWLEDELNHLLVQSPIPLPTETTRSLSATSSGVSRVAHPSKNAKRSDYTVNQSEGSVKTPVYNMPSRMLSTPSPSPNITLRTPARINRSRALPNPTSNSHALRSIPNPNTRIPVLSASYESRISSRSSSQPLASPLHIGSSHPCSKPTVPISRSRSTGDVPSPSILQSKAPYSPQPARTSRSSHLLSTVLFGVFDSEGLASQDHEFTISPIRHIDEEEQDDLYEEGASAWDTLAGSQPDWTGFSPSPEYIVDTDKPLKHLYTPPTTTVEDDDFCFLAESSKENRFERSANKVSSLSAQRTSAAVANTKFSTRIPASTSSRSKSTRTTASVDPPELGFESSDRFDSQTTLVDFDMSSTSTRTRGAASTSPAKRIPISIEYDSSVSSSDRKTPASLTSLPSQERKSRPVQSVEPTDRLPKKVIQTRYEAGNYRTTRIARSGHVNGT